MKIVWLIIMALAIGIFRTDAIAQKPDAGDGPTGIFSTRAEYERFMGDAKALAYGPDANPELRAMIPLLNDIALNRPIGWTAGKYNTERSTVGMLADERVRSELEMVDEQYEELKKLNAQIQQRLAEQISNLDLSDRKNLASRLHDMREQAREELNSLLLPHQIDRLRQIRLQNQLRHHSLADVLGSEPLKTLLEISDAQSRELQEAERQIEDELAKEIARLREKARDRLLSRLKPRQRSNLKQMLGDSFDSVDAKAATRSGDTKNSPDG